MGGDRISRLIEHWLRAHELFVGDVAHLRAVHALRYEDLVADPDGTLGRVFAFLGLNDPAPGRQAEAGINVDNFDSDRTLRTGVNESYFDQWRALRRSVRRPYYDALAWRYEGRARAFGYSLRDPGSLRTPTAPVPGLTVAERPPAAPSRTDRPLESVEP